MLRTGLSGGIGSGKSTVSARLAEHGAVVIDADRVAREVVQPGTPGLAQVSERFGPQVLADDGSLDRPALGALVFADTRARRDLEAITHPLIHDRTLALFAAAPADAVVVHDIPLLVELDRGAGYALTVIVDVPEDERLRRLVQTRGMPSDQARARIAAQADDEQRRAAADVLLDNSGSVKELHARVDALWRERLVPFEAALRTGAPPRPGPEAQTPDPAATRRAVARLRAALGDALVGADPVAPGADPVGSASGDAAPTPGLELTLTDPAMLTDETVRQALVDRGFLVTREPTSTAPAGLLWVDPVRPVACTVRAAGPTR